ncbi:hypothetical protein D3C85_1719470 [compost metagenome]
MDHLAGAGLVQGIEQCAQFFQVIAAHHLAGDLLVGQYGAVVFGPAVLALGVFAGDGTAATLAIHGVQQELNAPDGGCQTIDKAHLNPR